VEKKQLKDEAEIIRIAEAEARAKRREEAIASFFGADTDKSAEKAVAGDATQTASADAQAGAATATAGAPMTAIPAVSPASEQAFAAPREKSSGSFFSRFFSSDEADAAPAQSDANAPRPAPKP
jgi:hypothetical protein